MQTTECYKQRDVINALGQVKNDVDSLRGILKRLYKLKKAGLPIQHYFHHWILDHSKEMLNHAEILFDLIENHDT